MSRRAAPRFAALILPVIALFAPAAEAEDHAPGGDELQWNPAWPEFRTGEYVAGAVGLAALIASRTLPVRSAHWRGGVAFDESARRTLRLREPAARRWARDGSDIGIIVNESWPFFDALVVAGWYRNSPHLGLQQALISAEVVLVTTGLQGLVSYATSRERPYGRECDGGDLDPETRDCVNRDRYHSFFSGHSSQSFAAAAATCMHHSYVPLYGGAADRWACVGAFGVAATTALLRVATDVHYVSDVLVGAAIGTTIGLFLPWALHYRYGSPSEQAPEDAPSVVVVPSIGAGYGGFIGVVTF